jgi:hypothetical protein
MRCPDRDDLPRLRVSAVFQIAPDGISMVVPADIRTGPNHCCNRTGICIFRITEDNQNPALGGIIDALRDPNRRTIGCFAFNFTDKFIDSSTSLPLTRHSPLLYLGKNIYARYGRLSITDTKQYLSIDVNIPLCRDYTIQARNKIYSELRLERQEERPLKLVPRVSEERPVKLVPRASTAQQKGRRKVIKRAREPVEERSSLVSNADPSRSGAATDQRNLPLEKKITKLINRAERAAYIKGLRDGYNDIKRRKY